MKYQTKMATNCAPNNSPTTHSQGLPLSVAVDFLRSIPELALSTVQDGLPRIRAFQTMKLACSGNHVDLYFATAPFKAVWSQLHAQPYVEMLAMRGTVSVRLGGKAVFDVDDATQREIFTAKVNEVLSRLYASYDKLAYFRVRLDFIDYFDDAPVPCVYEHYDLSL